MVLPGDFPNAVSATGAMLILSDPYGPNEALLGASFAFEILPGSQEPDRLVVHWAVGCVVLTSSSRCCVLLGSAEVEGRRSGGAASDIAGRARARSDTVKLALSCAFNGTYKITGYAQSAYGLPC